MNANGRQSQLGKSLHFRCWQFEIHWANCNILMPDWVPELRWMRCWNFSVGIYAFLSFLFHRFYCRCNDLWIQSDTMFELGGMYDGFDWWTKIRSNNKFAQIQGNKEIGSQTKWNWLKWKRDRNFRSTHTEFASNFIWNLFIYSNGKA